MIAEAQRQPLGFHSNMHPLEFYRPSGDFAQNDQSAEIGIGTPLTVGKFSMVDRLGLRVFDEHLPASVRDFLNTGYNIGDTVNHNVKKDWGLLDLVAKDLNHQGHVVIHDVMDGVKRGIIWAAQHPSEAEEKILQATKQHSANIINGITSVAVALAHTKRNAAPILLSATIISLLVASCVPLGINAQQINNCPTISSNTYDDLEPHSEYKSMIPAAQNPNINVNLRQFHEVNEPHSLVDYGGDTDNIMPPDLGSIVHGRIPKITRTYKSDQLDNPWPVNLIGIETRSGEPLFAPLAGREIGGGNVVMVLHMTENSVTFTHSIGDTATDGYIIFVRNICPDPNLLKEYNRLDLEGRTRLPVLPSGKSFGTASGTETQLGVEDSGQLLPPNSKKDWWQLSTSGRFTPVFNTPTPYINKSP